MNDITVVIPTIPPRHTLLQRAITSVEAQQLPPVNVVMECDTSRQGAAVTRHRGLMRVRTDWVAFLDDDDEFKPEHLARLRYTATVTNADMVFSWYDVVGGTDPRPEEFGKIWDPSHPRQTTITTLVRTELAQDVGGFLDAGETVEDLVSPDRHYAGEDWRFTQRVNEHGLIYHLSEKTWLWHHHGSNTSGLPNRW